MHGHLQHDTPSPTRAQLSCASDGRGEQGADQQRLLVRPGSACDHDDASGSATLFARGPSEVDSRPPAKVRGRRVWRPGPRPPPILSATGRLRKELLATIHAIEVPCADPEVCRVVTGWESDVASRALKAAKAHSATMEKHARAFDKMVGLSCAVCLHCSAATPTEYSCPLLTGWLTCVLHRKHSSTPYTCCDTRICT